MFVNKESSYEVHTGPDPGDAARFRSPETVAILPVVDLDMLLSLALVWRRDNTSPLLANFIIEVQRLAGVRALNKG